MSVAQLNVLQSVAACSASAASSAMASAAAAGAMTAVTTTTLVVNVVLLAAMKQRGDHPSVQEHHLVALYHHLLVSVEQQHKHHALPEATSDSYSSLSAKQPILSLLPRPANKQKQASTSTELPSTVLEAMKRNEHSMPVQTQGLQVLLV